ncbi:MAG: ATP-binding protein [Rhodospirillales bacterium]|nr:ATP-binding protein [Rhodospirillales bacterium]
MTGPKDHARTRPAFWSRIQTRMTVWFCLLFAAAIALTEIITIVGLPFGVEGTMAQRRAESLNLLNNIADIKKRQLTEQIQQIYAHAAALAKSPSLVSFLTELHAQKNFEARDALEASASAQKSDSTLLLSYIHQFRSSYPFFRSIHILEPGTGETILSTEKRDQQGISDQPFLEFVQLTRQSQIIGIDRAPDGGAPIVHIGHVIIDNDENLQGILVLSARTDDIIKPLLSSSENWGETGEAVLVTREGQPLVQLDHPLAEGRRAVPMEDRIEALPAKLAALEGEGVVESEDYRGVPVLAAYRHIPMSTEWGWGLVVKIDKAELLRPVKLEIQNGILGGLIGILAVFFLTIGASRFFTRPIANLADVAVAMSKGDYSLRTDLVRKDEIGFLGCVFDGMAARVQSTIEQLHEEVEERTEAEEVLRQTVEKLRETQTELVKAEKMASLGGLVAGIAHEINTPIGVGVTAISHLREKVSDLEQAFTGGTLAKTAFEDFVDATKQSTEIISANLGRASELIKSFKQVAVDQSSEEVRDIALLDYVDQVLLSLRPQLKRTPHEISVEGDRSIHISTHPGALSQIVTNLIMNSLSHAYDDGSSGHIRIFVEPSGQTVKLTYADDGQGMEESVRAKVFEPFFTTKRGTGGSGLGMHIVYNLITQTLGGNVTCRSAPGKGTAFDILIPTNRTGGPT